MSIEVIKPGIQSLLVGIDRTGFRAMGIGTGSAMDAFAREVANYLVGNSSREAVVEIYQAPAEFSSHENLLISITGQAVEVYLNDVAAPAWKPLYMPKNTVLKINPIGSGGRTYWAVNSGWKASEWLGSYSTHVGVTAGGLQGRTLLKKDWLQARTPFNELPREIAFPWGISTNELNKVYLPSHKIRCVVSAETNLLSDHSHMVFTSASFTITDNSNKMGFRLAGPPLALNKPLELVSSSVDMGTLQLLPDGNLIVLMADHQTTGGYPRIASVIKADLPKLAQRNPRDKITFSLISPTKAETLLIARQNQLEEIRKSCLLQLLKLI
jgi:antagonist of KipI